MALATRCPSCHALFRVVADQLKLRGGLVRCGACGHVFDAIGTLSYLDDASLRPASLLHGAATLEDNSALTLRFTPGGSRAGSLEADAAIPDAIEAPASAGVPGAEALPRIEPGSSAGLDTGARFDGPSFPPADETVPVVKHEPVPDEAYSRDQRSEEPSSNPKTTTWTPDNDVARDGFTGAERLEANDPEVAVGAFEGTTFLEQQDKPRRRGTVVAVAAGEALLFITLLTQLTLIFRAEIVAHWPETRPALVRACQALNCSVGWPMQGEMLAVVGSELQSLPGTSALELTAVVRNRAAITLALPAIELTLTDTQNRALARRVFAPGEYLAAIDAAARLGDGIEAGADMTIKITFEARGLAPAGFVVYPFYL